MIQENSRADSLLYRGLPDLASRMLDTQLGIQEIGAYTLVRQIGKGGMGLVYLAERKDTGKQVAMKFLTGGGMSPARRALFTHEIETHAKLSHPYIAAQYDAGELPDGTPWFVMEYVEGQHFIEYFQSKEAGLSDRLNLFRQVCQALEYLHSKGIIHSDLKPSNILIDESGTPRVLDFGIAKKTGEIAGTPSALQLMTRAYAAPERIERGIVDHSTDVYSLGLIFCEMLDGRTPRASKRELDKICKKAVHPDPAERYRSVEALRRDIEHFQKYEPLEGPPASRGYRLERFTMRHRSAVIAGALAVLLFMGMAAFFTVRLARERNTAIAELNRKNLVEHFLFNLFQGEDKDAGPAADLRVSQLIGRGVQEANALTHDPELQAEFYLVLGRIYEQLGHFDEADGLLTRALKQRYDARAKAGDVAESLLALGELRLDQGRLTDASRIVNNALALQKAESPKDGLVTARTESLLGRVLFTTGHYNDALQLFRQAERIQAGRSDAQDDLAATLVGLSDVYFELGRGPDAAEHAQQAMALHEKLHGRNHPLVAVDLRNLGNIQQRVNHDSEAERSYRDAVAIEQAWYGDGHPETADMQIYLAQVLAKEGRMAEAQPLLDRAASTILRSYPESHPRVALVLNEIGDLYFQNKKWNQAEPYYVRALGVYRRTLGENNRLTTIVQNNLASIYLKQEQYSKAEKIFAEVVTTLLKLNVGDSIDAGITRIKLGRSLTRQHRYKEAEVQLREGCRIVTAQAGPNSEWVTAVQPDLALIKKALGNQ